MDCSYGTGSHSSLSSNSGSGRPQFVVTTQDGSAYIISGAESSLQQLNYPTISRDNVDSDWPPLVVTSYDDASATSIAHIVELPPSAVRFVIVITPITSVSLQRRRIGDNDNISIR